MTRDVPTPAFDPQAFLEFHEIGQSSLDSSLRLYGEWTKGWQALATEIGNYQQRSFEEGSAALGQLAGAKSIEQALAIQASFAQRAYEGTIEQVSRLGSLYVDLARGSLEPGATAVATDVDVSDKSDAEAVAVTSSAEPRNTAKAKARTTGRGSPRRRAA